MALPQVVTDFSDAVDDAMDRVVAMQKIVIENAQAKKIDWQYDYSKLYWRNTIGGHTPQRRNNNQVAFRIVVNATLIAGYTQQGISEDRLQSVVMWTWIPRVTAYFSNSHLLVYTRGQGQKPPRYFEDTGLTITSQGVRIGTDSDGARTYEAPFNITLPFVAILDGSLG